MRASPTGGSSNLVIQTIREGFQKLHVYLYIAYREREGEKERSKQMLVQIVVTANCRK